MFHGIDVSKKTIYIRMISNIENELPYRIINCLIELLMLQPCSTLRRPEYFKVRYGALFIQAQPSLSYSPY